MPEYLYPGVYVEEVDKGNKPIEGVSTSTVGFLGVAERGPLQPTFITSFADFTRAFGGYVTDRYLTYAVEGCFQKGGERCFVMRVVSADAKIAELDGGRPMRVQAVGPGKWGNNIAVQTVAGPKNSDLFRLLVAYWADGLPSTLPDLTQ